MLFMMCHFFVKAIVVFFYRFYFSDFGDEIIYIYELFFSGLYIYNLNITEYDW